MIHCSYYTYNHISYFGSAENGAVIPIKALILLYKYNALSMSVSYSACLSVVVYVFSMRMCVCSVWCGVCMCACVRQGIHNSCSHGPMRSKTRNREICLFPYYHITLFSPNSTSPSGSSENFKQSLPWIEHRVRTQRTCELGKLYLQGEGHTRESGDAMSETSSVDFSVKNRVKMRN